VSAAEILEELPKLTPTELQHIRDRILELADAQEDAQELEETPELLAAIDEGQRSAENDETYTLDETRAKVAEWIAKLSSPRPH
jgi:hypothetical protein